MSFVYVLVRSRKRTSLGGHRCGAGHGVSDSKVSEWNERKAMRTRKYQCFSVCIYQNVPCLVLKGVYIYISPLLLAIVAFIVALVLLL